MGYGCNMLCGNVSRLVGKVCKIPATEQECAQIPGCQRIGLEHYVDSWNYVKNSELVAEMCTAPESLSRERCLQDSDLANLRAALASNHPLRQNLHHLFMEKCGTHEDLRQRLVMFPDFQGVAQ